MCESPVTFFCLQSKLKNCEKCHCVAYCSTKCSEEDKKDHEKSCFWLKTILQDYLASQRTQHDLARKWCPRPYLISRDLPFSIQVFFQQELQNFCRDAEIKKLDLRLLELLPCLGPSIKEKTFFSRFLTPYILPSEIFDYYRLANLANFDPSPLKNGNVLNAR